MLEGDEVPEQLMIWIQDYDNNILNNIALSAPAKLGFLRRLVAFEAQSILSQVERDYKDHYAEPADISLLDDYKIQKEIRDKFTTDNQVRTYFGTAGDAQCKKIRVKHIIREAIHRFKIQIFGNEIFGLKSFIQLKRTMNGMRIGPNCDVKSWAKRFDTFQHYLPKNLMGGRSKTR